MIFQNSLTTLASIIPGGKLLEDADAGKSSHALDSTGSRARNLQSVSRYKAAKTICACKSPLNRLVRAVTMLPNAADVIVPFVSVINGFRV